MPEDDPETYYVVTWQGLDHVTHTSDEFPHWGDADEFCDDLPGWVMHVQIHTRSRSVVPW